MLISSEWLKRYIDITLTPEKLAERMTMIGLETNVSRRADESNNGSWVIEVDITPNRSDCLSVLGIARDISAMTGVPIKEQKYSAWKNNGITADHISVKVEIPDRCPQYSAMLLRDVTIAPSPGWLSDILCSVGLRPINNVVDVTNFILWDEGQPLHAFDYNKISGKKISVRTARHNEKFETLDGKEHILTVDDLLIADRDRGIALAGIMGGVNSEVCDTTKDILIESACFEPIGIRKTSRRLGIQTDSSHRFGRGIDTLGVTHALKRAASMITEIAGGNVYSETEEHSGKKIPANSIRLRKKRLDHILGIKIEVDEVQSILQRLGLGVIKEGDDFKITVPSCRRDIEREIDLIEEVIRFHGYGNICSSIPSTPTIPAKIPDRILFQRDIRSLLKARGLQEAINYSFIGNKFPCNSDKNVKIRNPINQEMSLMRLSLIPSLIENALMNINKGAVCVDLFEIGKVYLNSNSGATREKTMLAICMTPSANKDLWKKDKRDFYDLKGIALAILNLSGINNVVFAASNNTKNFHPGKSATILSGETVIGHLGELHPAITKRFDFTEPLLLLEFDIESLCSKRIDVPTYIHISKYPAANRDLTLILDETIDAQKVEDAIKKSGGVFLKKVVFFDFYEGKQIPAGKKSLTCTLVFESHERTLTEEELSCAYQEILDHIKKKLGGTLRG